MGSSHIEKSSLNHNGTRFVPYFIFLCTHYCSNAYTVCSCLEWHEFLLDVEESDRQGVCHSMSLLLWLRRLRHTFVFIFQMSANAFSSNRPVLNTKLNDTWISPVRGYVTHGLKQHSEYTFCTCLCYDVLILSIIHGTLKVMHKKNKLVHKNSSHCRKLSVWHSKSWFMLLMFLFFSHWRWQP